MARFFYFYNQLEEMDCGATCLRMVARYHGRYYSLEHLRELTQISQEGVSLLAISDAAEHIGMQSLALRVSYEQLAEEIPVPAIVPWQGNHFVVVYRIDRKHVWIADPSKGKSKLTREKFLQSWADSEEGNTGVVLVLETTPSFYDRDREGIDKSSLGYVFSYFLKYRYLIVQLFGGLVITSLIQLAFPFLIKSLVDVGIGNVDYGFIKLIIIAQLVLFLTQTGVEVLRRWILLHIGVRVNISLVSDFLIKLTRLPLRFFDTRMTGDLLQRIADHERVQRFLTSTTLTSVFGLVNFVVFSLVLLWWSTFVFLAFACGTLVHLAWVLFFQRYKRELDYKRFDESAQNQNQLIELISGMREIKLHNAEKQKRWAWERTQAKLFRTGMRTLEVDQFQRSGGTVINESKNLFITLIVAMAVLEGDMTLGMLVAIHYIVGQLNGPINQFVEFTRSYQETQISLERMNEIHSKPDEEHIGQKISMLPELRDIHLENVSFAYQGVNSPTVLRKVDLHIPKDKITAVVGSSGSGKSTLLKLLLGFYEPTEGRVLLGDTSLNAILSRLWRAECGIVMQDGFIFSDTIARNIALGDEVIDEAKLLRAVKVANIQHFIESLPMSYGTPIGHEGAGLSQGQKQRLLIARAVYKDPSYIFLDEATTALDVYSEMLLMDNLIDYFRGRTMVIVAHRRSTIRHADHIIVLESGEVVEQGSHETLMYQNGPYYAMIRNQRELGL